MSAAAREECCKPELPVVSCVGRFTQLASVVSFLEESVYAHWLNGIRPLRFASPSARCQDSWRPCRPSPSPQWWRLIHSSLYLPEPVYEALRKVAFDERIKIHDLAIEGINAVLRRRGLPTVDALKAGKKR